MAARIPWKTACLPLLIFSHNVQSEEGMFWNVQKAVGLQKSGVLDSADVINSWYDSVSYMNHIPS